MQLLNLPEFAEWLRLRGGEHAQWADEILTLQAETTELEDAADKAEGERDDATEKLDAVTEAIAEHVPLFAHGAIQFGHDPTPAETIERAGNILADIRVALVEAGALSADDQDTDLPSLLTALLS